MRSPAGTVLAQATSALAAAPASAGVHAVRGSARMPVGGGGHVLALLDQVRPGRRTSPAWSLSMLTAARIAARRSVPAASVPTAILALSAGAGLSVGLEDLVPLAVQDDEREAFEPAGVLAVVLGAVPDDDRIDRVLAAQVHFPPRVACRSPWCGSGCRCRNAPSVLPSMAREASPP